MLSSERRNRILDLIKEQKTVNISELVEKFGASVATIRRDLTEMENQKLLHRVYGGAVAINDSQLASYAMRSDTNTSKKKAIGREAANLISDGECIVMDIGTTTQEVAKNLHNKKNLLVVTSNLTILNEFSNTPEPTISVTCLGGELLQTQQSFLGAIPEKALENYFFDKAIIGTAGADISNGISNFCVPASSLTAKIISRAKEVILVTDSSKFDNRKLVVTSNWDKIDVVVTDSDIDEKYKDAFRGLGIRLVIAK